MAGYTDRSSPWLETPWFKTWTRGAWKQVSDSTVSRCTFPILSILGLISQVYQSLAFQTSLDNNAVSVAGRQGSLYVPARNADWVGKLVPDSYRCPYGSGLSSEGLTGPLPLILGLMALSQPSGQEQHAFTQDLWRDRAWRGANGAFRGIYTRPKSNLPFSAEIKHFPCSKKSYTHVQVLIRVRTLLRVESSSMYAVTSSKIRKCPL